MATGAWMPAICNNVRVVEGAGFTNRTLVFDKGSSPDRPEQRGNSLCPTAAGPRQWKRNHVCPERNQPGVIDKYGGPSRPNPTALRDPLRPRAQANAYEIVFPPGQPPMGNNWLRYSCDEYPPKT